ncbi:hypothetical protein VNO78_06669 [Psophocarpus tetragonolobus]|uniref:Receptor-like serine/threonine-protein kinase n=1 Tax=Psophocarpus tetragonolobus TaxID=3891 RepID=A0AAN9SSR2_PSOTE
MVCSKQSHLLLVFKYSWLWWVTCISVNAANHTLKPGDTLNTTDELCSENSKYCIKFYQMNPGVNYTFLTINDNGKDNAAVVWVANRDQRIVDKDSAVLVLDKSGVLKIESNNGVSIILYSSPQPSNNTVASLMNTGNFVLQQLHPNGTKSVLWQSFDYPTDTLLPGMKLGVNHKTSHNWSLVSWLGLLNARFGAFSLEWEPITRELIIKRRGQLCWKSGELRDNDGSMHNTQYKIVSNENESYFEITSSNDELTKWVLLETGQVINRKGDDNVARADMCYGFNTDEGCQKWEELPSCRNRGDAFEAREVYVNSNLKTYLANTTYGTSDCRDICWKNCSCDGYTRYYTGGTGCVFLHWNSTDGANFASGGEMFYILVKNTYHKGTNKWIWITIVAIVVLLVICAFILILTFKKRKHMFQDKKRKELKTRMLDSTIKYLEDEFKNKQDLKVFKYTSILSATNDFSPENLLGQGGFGPVYKGILPSGQEAAIKRLSKTSRQGIVEFKNELMLICELQHTNLVQLLGCCIHEDERILIYEYMPNKSLDLYLFGCSRTKFLDWKKRFNIIEGIAQEQQSTTNTSRIVGTYGYMSPEYAMEGIFSIKSDVYSFGVLILEIVSGRRNTSFYDVNHPINLIGYAWELWNQGVPLQLMDSLLNDSFDPNEVKRCIHIGLLCIEQSADDRPTMSHIVSMLTNESAIVALPQRPAFYVERKKFEWETTSKEFRTTTTEEITASSEI